jgi:23S rRNA (cytosine1962-C5)-methyltransferase
MPKPTKHQSSKNPAQNRQQTRPAEPVSSPYRTRTSQSGQNTAPTPAPSRPTKSLPTRPKAAAGSKSTARSGPKTTRPNAIAAPARQVARNAELHQKLKLPVPSAAVTRRASESLRAGHVWVYASEIEQTELSSGPAPALIPVVDNRGIPLGTALYSAASQIVLRMVSRDLLKEEAWLRLLDLRLRAAIQRRKPLLDAQTDACRLVFSEADELPGLIVDKYAGIVVLQLLTKGLDTAQTRDVCIQALSEELQGDLTIWERPDPRIRELEGLSAPATTPLYARSAPIAHTIFRLNSLSFHFDVNSGQKTGAFLDQLQNYAAAAAWAQARGVKKALDVCTYQGGFALHLAQVCETVTGIDASRVSLEVAEHNIELNTGQLKAQVDWVEGDAFEILRGWSAASESKPDSAAKASEPGEPWDLIVLDPPAFAKSKRAVEGALRGYKELNLRALRMLRPGGLLITCSCSHHVSWAELESTVASAAIDAHRRVTLLERRGAAQDHPVILNLPETEYLKCLICQVD